VPGGRGRGVAGGGRAGGAIGGAVPSVPPSSGEPAATTAPLGPAPVAFVTADPANFTVRQIGNEMVVLSWDPVPGASSYMLRGPGWVQLQSVTQGVVVKGTSQTVTAVPAGSQTWTVATMYDPGGVLTPADKWPRAATAVLRNYEEFFRRDNKF
jgi:hypothetical protein